MSNKSETLLNFTMEIPKNPADKICTSIRERWKRLLQKHET